MSTFHKLGRRTNSSRSRQELAYDVVQFILVEYGLLHIQRNIATRFPDILIFDPYRDELGRLFVGLAVRVMAANDELNPFQKSHLLELERRGWKVVLLMNTVAIRDFLSIDYFPNLLTPEEIITTYQGIG